MTDDAATEWMIDHLKHHREQLDLNGYEHYGAQVQGLEVTRRILERVLPGESFDLDPTMYDAWQYHATTAISRALGILENRHQILAYLGPSGPTMPVENLHPVVWTNAAELWRIEQYRAAVARACLTKIG